MVSVRASPHRRSTAGLLVVVLVLAACGGSAATTAPDGSGSAPTAPPDGQSAEPTAPPASQGGNGGTGSVPTLTDGDWTAGTAHADVTGDVSATLDANLLVGLATTQGAATQLTYTTTDGQISVAINGPDVSVSVSNGQWVGGGGTTTMCTSTFTKGDATNVAGTVTCNGSPIIDASGVAGKSANLVVTFEASR